MNAFDKLMKMDTAKLNELPTKEITSKMLLFRFDGDKEAAKIKIRALSARDLQYVSEMTTDNNGEVNEHRVIDGSAWICTHGIVEPDVNNRDLIEHFGARNAQDLCEKLFQMEMADISQKIVELSNAGVTEDDVKN